MSSKLKKIKIFLASSNELEQERDDFRLFIGQLNDKFIDKKIYFEIVQWEHFLDAISDTRLQDEYNKKLSEADIALCLFFTKVGVFSEEEFNTAYKTFKAIGKPRIWTYFKDAPISTAAITNEINTLLAFKKKLSDLGHFFTVYSSTADLHNQFRDQLDRLFPILINTASGGSKNRTSKAEEIILPPAQNHLNTLALSKAAILQLIDLDIDNAFEKLDVIYLNKNASYNDLTREYFNQPNNFAINNFRAKLKRFVSLTWK